jgi:hypothetical protein
VPNNSLCRDVKCVKQGPYSGVGGPDHRSTSATECHSAETNGARSRDQSQHQRGDGNMLTQAPCSRHRNTKGTAKGLGLSSAHWKCARCARQTSQDRRKHDSQTLCQWHAEPQPRQPGNLPRDLMEDQGIPRLWTNDKADQVGTGRKHREANGSHAASPGPISVVERRRRGVCFRDTVLWCCGRVTAADLLPESCRRPRDPVASCHGPHKNEVSRKGPVANNIT